MKSSRTIPVLLFTAALCNSAAIAQFSVTPPPADCGFIGGSDPIAITLVAIAPDDSVSSGASIIPSAYPTSQYPFPYFDDLEGDQNTNEQFLHVPNTSSYLPFPMVLLSDARRLAFMTRDFDLTPEVQVYDNTTNPPTPIGPPVPSHDRYVVFQVTTENLQIAPAAAYSVLHDNSQHYVSTSNTTPPYWTISYDRYLRYFAMGDEVGNLRFVAEHALHYCQPPFCNGPFMILNFGSSRIGFLSGAFSPCGLQEFINAKYVSRFVQVTGNANSPEAFTMDSFTQSATSLPYFGGFQYGFYMEGTYLGCTWQTGTGWGGDPIYHRQGSGDGSQIPGRMLAGALRETYNELLAPHTQGLVFFGAEGDGTFSGFELGVYTQDPHYFESPANYGAVRVLHDGISCRDVSNGWSNSTGNVVARIGTFGNSPYTRRLSAARDGSVAAVIESIAGSGIQGVSSKEAVVARLRNPALPDDVVSYIRSGQRLPLPPEVFVSDPNWTPPVQGINESTGMFLRAHSIAVEPDHSLVLAGWYLMDMVANGEMDTGEERLGIWRFTVETGWQPVAVAGQYAIDRGTVIGRHLGTGGAGFVTSQDRDEMAYLSTFRPTSGGAGRGALFYRANACGTTRLLLRSGDPYTLPGGLTATVGSIGMVCGSNGEDGRPQALNNRGELAFTAVLALESGFLVEPYVAILYASMNPPITPFICGDLDFNNDGVYPSEEDTMDFFTVLAGGLCPTSSCDSIDFNGNSVFPEDADVICYFDVLAGGTCDGACN